MVFVENLEKTRQNADRFDLCKVRKSKFDDVNAEEDTLTITTHTEENNNRFDSDAPPSDDEQ
jgi:hypothetical protein